MRIMLLNQAPRTASRGPAYDVEPIERLVNSYASPGTRIEIGFPDNFEGAEIFHTMGAQSGLNGLHHMIETPSIVRKIVWAAENANPAVLHAYTATDLTHELYNSTQAAASRDSFGNGNKFIVPTIANGHVYVGTVNGVGVFGLLN